MQELAERLKKEEQLIAKQRQAELAAKEYELKFRDSQGRGIVEEKNTKYIVQRTTGNVEVLDPTGRVARVDPSQVTDIADFSFGLGKSSRIPADNMKRITEQIRQNLKVEKDELGEYRRLVNGAMKKAGILEEDGKDEKKIKKSISFDDEPVRVKDMSSLEGFASPAGAMPGIDPSATMVNFGGNELEKSSLLKIAVEEDGQMHDPSGGISSAKKSKFPPPQLSKFERDSLERAKGRHRARIEYGTEQVAGGRLFKGQAFVSKPDELIFKDFDVGKKYKKHFLMTNVSYTFNSFKLLELDDDVIDFFTITYEKPGRMSAGVSCTLEIVFAPEMNKDILTTIRFFTETGPVEVPLKCLIKRCAPRIVNPTIDFGGITIGQKLSSSLKIKNSQALSTEFEIVPVSSGGDGAPGDEAVEEYVEEVPDYAMDAAVNESDLLYRVQRVVTQVYRKMKYENPFPLSASFEAGVVDGYGNTSLDIICAPLSVGALQQLFAVRFKGVEDSSMTVDDSGELVKREQFVTVSVTGEEVPIYLEEETIDLRCTLFDRIYRKAIVLKNRAKQAYRVSIKVIPAFSRFVEVNPTILFVQAKSAQSVNVKFSPTVDMLSKIRYFTSPYEEYKSAALVVLPIEIRVVGQDLPLYFMLRSSVCPSTIQLSTSLLDFGKVYVGQQSSKVVTLTNLCMLPQKVAFVRLKKELSVKPNDGFAVLLPNESMDFEIKFSPVSAINFDLDLNLLTSLNDSYTLKVVAEGIAPPIEFSSSVIRMRTTSPGERVVESVVGTNNTPHHQSFEVILPDSRFSWLKISPSVVQLEPGKSCRLEIEYLPPENAVELNPNEWHQSNASEIESPFDDWLDDCGWMCGKGMFGELQWFKPPRSANQREIIAGNGDSESVEHNSLASKMAESAGAESETPVDIRNDDEPEGKEELRCDLAEEEWGIIGKWSIPILLKPRNKAAAMSATSTSQTGTLTVTSPGRGGTARGHKAPLYLSIQTTVNLPQIEVDMKLIDFGQISVGTRMIKSFKIFNRTFQSVNLKSVGFNAIGPFNLIRPIKEIGPRESLNVLVECLPQLPGLIVEVLEISALDESIMGNRIRVAIRVQGLKPSISVEKLSPPPPNWRPTCGILDFGHCLMLDNNVVKKFTIQNKSTFTIDAKIMRVVSTGLSPAQQADMIERTAGGLPIFSYRPERVQIREGSSADIEVVFRPDRARFQPFREDLDIFIGKTDEVYRVGLFGRSWPRQYLVTVSDPRDESFILPTVKEMSAVEDTLGGFFSPKVRSLTQEARKAFNVRFPNPPHIHLHYPDPFSAAANPSTYTEVSAAVVAPSGKGSLDTVNGYYTVFLHEVI